MAGLDKIPAIIIESTDMESAVLALNREFTKGRFKFSLEEADGYQRLIKEHNFTQEDWQVKLVKNNLLLLIN